MQYFVVMIDYGRRAARPSSSGNHPARGRLADRVGRIQEYQLCHEIADCSVEDITADILTEAALPEIDAAGPNLQAD
jgi:hypothetical protein